MPRYTPGSAEFQAAFHRRFSELVQAGGDPTESAASALEYVGSLPDEMDVVAASEPSQPALETSASAPAPTPGGADGSDGAPASAMDEDPGAPQVGLETSSAATSSGAAGDDDGPSPGSMDEDAADEAALMEAADAAEAGDEDEAAAIAMSMADDPSAAPKSSSSSSSSSSSASAASLDVAAEEHDPPEPPVPPERLIDVAILRQLRLEATKGGEWDPLEKYVERAFSDPLVLSASFVADAGGGAAAAAAAASSSEGDGSMQLDTAAGADCADPLGAAVDCEAMDAAYAEIEAADRDELNLILYDASKRAVTSMLEGLKQRSAMSTALYPTPKGGLRALIFLLSNPLILSGVTEEPQELVGHICAFVAALRARSRKLLTSWLASDACSKDRFGQLLKCLQQFITIICYQASGTSVEDLQGVTDAIKAMHILYCANIEAGEAALAAWKEEGAKVQEGVKAPFKAFYNDGINDELFDVEGNPQFVRQAYRKWVSDQATEKKRAAARAKLAASSGGAEDLSADLNPDWMPESYISYPFILSPAIKAKVLQLDAQSQMHRGVEAELLTAILSGQPNLVMYLILRVRRSHIIQDTMGQLARLSPAALKKPLKVVFEGEEGIDEGGVQKEFMQVVTRQLLDAQFGMFKVNEDSNLMYFNPHTFEIGLEFELIGTLLGVAIYNSIILDIQFPMVVYKRLKGHKPDIHDLTVLDPQLGRNLQKMVDFEGDVEATFGQVFQVAFEAWGVMTTHDLVPNGGDVPVTNDNVQDYVDRYVQWVLVDSVQQQYDSFHKGFMRVCGGQAIELFSPRELELLVCGNPVLDFEALERVTQYDDGFDVGSGTVKHFWRAVHSFGEDEKRLLLKFSTGSDRAPINGLASMKFVISRNGPDSDRLPTSHTCFNHLLLPEYESYEKTEEKLLCAIRQSEGFGLR